MKINDRLKYTIRSRDDLEKLQKKEEKQRNK